MDTIVIRDFRDDDALETAQIYFDAVRIGTASHYDQRQREAWAPEVPEEDAWRQRLGAQKTLVAEQDGRLIGFIALTPDGHIDLLFVLPEVMGRGVAKKLYDAVISEAERSGLSKLDVEASHLARSFFEREGWSVVRRRRKRRNKVELITFDMELHRDH